MVMRCGWLAVTGLEDEQLVVEQRTETGRNRARPAERLPRLTHPDSLQLRRRAPTTACTSLHHNYQLDNGTIIIR